MLNERPVATGIPSNLEDRAAEELESVFGEGHPITSGIAPGRVTLVGEHVDYAGGKIACMAVDLKVAAATRTSKDGRWRVISRDRVVERAEPSMNRDIGDRVFAACLAAAEVTGDSSATEIAIAGDLPEGAGLSSSAAVVCATLMARLNAAGISVTSRELIQLAIRAEREIAGIPCGDMDQWAVVASRQSSVLIFDAAAKSAEFVAWPWTDIVLVAVNTGTPHDIGGEGYRTRRHEAEEVLRQLGVRSCQQIGESWREIEDRTLRKRARHLSLETERVVEAAGALKKGDAVELGRLISSSHESLRRDYEVSTEVVDAVVRAAMHVDGCLGARLVGGGFGGSVIALCKEKVAERIREAMAAACGVNASSQGWILRPAQGVLPM